ncbi:LINE-1 retrotransposable element ORF1 protein [Plecturocebus cupreus]
MKEKMLRAARERGRVTHKGKPIRLTADLSAETLQARREWGPIFNILKRKELSTQNFVSSQTELHKVEMKEKMLRAAREKVPVTHKGKPIRLTADFSAETLQARREWGPTFNILKENNFQPRISYLAKLSFISEGKIKFFANKQVLRDYITTRPALQELLKEALHMDGNNQYQPFQKHTKRQGLTLTPRIECSGSISVLAHCNLCLRGSDDPLNSASQVAGTTEAGFHHVAQAGLELLISSHPPTSVFQNSGIIVSQSPMESHSVAGLKCNVSPLTVRPLCSRTTGGPLQTLLDWESPTVAAEQQGLLPVPSSGSFISEGYTPDVSQNSPV